MSRWRSPTAPVTGRYPDRASAGEVLADELRRLAGRADVVVLGLPRGGVPVAAPVARALAAPLDVLLVRKLGLPAQPELAMGAIASIEGQVEVVGNAAVLRRLKVPDAIFAKVLAKERAVLDERDARYRQGRAPAPVRDHVVIVVDDGLATGSTMRAALSALRLRSPARLVVAVPVGAPSTAEALEAEADEVVCPLRPDPFLAVGQAYADFAPTTDDEVRAALESG